jgi:hypothetical protein
MTKGCVPANAFQRRPRTSLGASPELKTLSVFSFLAAHTRLVRNSLLLAQNLGKKTFRVA